MTMHEEPRSLALPALIVAGGALMLLTLYWTFFRAPFEVVMGAAQKIFYLHVPAAIGMYAGATVCFLGSATYLYYGEGERADAFARAGAEAATFFGAMGLLGGSLWAKPAWGFYWSWEPRISSTLLQLLIYASYLMLRGFAGDGEAERKFAAALGVLGTANLPVIRYAVRIWGGNHPSVMTNGGGGLGHPDMYVAFYLGMATMVNLALAFAWTRSRLHLARTRLGHIEERALERGLLGDEA
jgi:heme exporter protein C